MRLWSCPHSCGRSMLAPRAWFTTRTRTDSPPPALPSVGQVLALALAVVLVVEAPLGEARSVQMLMRDGMVGTEG